TELAVPVISDCIAREYYVKAEDQLAFTMRAVNKFRNKEIYDTVYRNARQAERKLKQEERLYEPLRLAVKYQQKTGCIILTAAAAMHYAVEKENADLSALLHLYEPLHVVKQLKEVYGMLQNKTPLQEIIHFCMDI
ncbi:MAG: mannitol dehydrogenase, partial [Clostridium sp.]